MDNLTAAQIVALHKAIGSLNCEESIQQIRLLLSKDAK